MAYQSLYRKYRPQTFSDVIGQGHVVRTLQNALVAGRVAHGYLFTGTRGTAKTTVARLVAKALNCLSADGPVPEPCNACDACLSITQGSCIDVIEMDAASHRGVADIEEVRKAVGYGAMQFRYKVFIIDEAHQLSSDAKDAFLKTLEEPPPGVVFILATTEPQAIPITIRSRCQQFDFKRGSLTDISQRLKHVLDCEGVSYAPEAINLVARGAEGSYRDSLSLLEQVLAFTPTHIGAADVQMVLGALDTEQLARVTECVARRDAPGALALAGEILDSGKEARTLLKALAAHFRDLLLVSVGGPAAANELASEEVARLQTQAHAFAPEQILKAIDLLNQAQGETRWNNQHRLLVEISFLKLMTLGDASNQPLATAPLVFNTPALPAVSALTALPALPPATPTPSPSVSAFRGRRGGEEEEEEDREEDEEDEYVPERVVTEPEPQPAPVKPEPSGFSLFDLLEPEVASKPEPKAVVREPQPQIDEDELPPLPDDEFAPTAFFQVPVVESSDPRVNLDAVRRAWPQFLGQCERISMQTCVMMAAAQPIAVEGRTIILSFTARMNFDMMNAPKKQEFVRKLLARVIDPELETVPIRFVLDENAPPPPQRTIARQKVRHDPMAVLESLTRESVHAESAPAPAPWTPPVASPPTPRVQETRGEASWAKTTQKNHAFEPTPPPDLAAMLDPEGAGLARPGSRKAQALSEPLVQDILSTFGGELLEE